MKTLMNAQAAIDAADKDARGCGHVRDARAHYMLGHICGSLKAMQAERDALLFPADKHYDLVSVECEDVTWQVQVPRNPGADIRHDDLGCIFVRGMAIPEDCLRADLRDDILNAAIEAALHDALDLERQRDQDDRMDAERDRREAA